MRTYSTRQVQSKTKEILDAAAAGEEVRITRGKQVFKVVLVEGEQTEPVQGASTDDLLSRLVEQSSQQTDLLRQLVEHKDTVLDDLIKQMDDQRPQPAAVARPMLTVAIPEDEVVDAEVVDITQVPEALKEPEPELPGEPTEAELKLAAEYFGLTVTSDGWVANQQGIMSAIAEVKKRAKENADGPEARIMALDPSSDERIDFLTSVQLAKFDEAFKKRAQGHEQWLGRATPPRT